MLSQRNNPYCELLSGTNIKQFFVCLNTENRKTDYFFMCKFIQLKIK